MRSLPTRCGAAVAVAIFAFCAADRCQAEPAAGSPTAAQLVSGVLDQENRLYAFSSLLVRTQSTGGPTARRIAAYQAETGQELRPTALETSEVVFDATRFRSRFEDGGSVRLQIWNGEARKTYQVDRQDHPQPTDRYTLSSTMMHGFMDNFYWLWLQGGVRRFWWSPLLREDPFAAGPEDYVLISEEDFHGHPCYRLECQRAMRRLFIGVEDRRLHGVVALFAPTDAEELAIQSRAAEKEFSSKQEAGDFEAELSPQQLRQYRQRYERERFALQRPYVEVRFDDYRQVAPGLWIPWQCVLDRFSAESGKTFLSAQTETRIVEFQIDPPLTAALFDVEIPEGTDVWEERQGLWPPLNYKYQRQFTAAEWQAIGAPRERDLAEAEREKAFLAARIGQAAPEFPAGVWSNSEPLSWQELRGKIVILEFTSYSCGACSRDLPTLVQLHRERERSGVVVVAVHAAEERLAPVQDYIHRNAIEFPLFVDVAETGSFGKTFKWFHVNAIPQSVLVDARGTVVAVGHLEDILYKAHGLAKPKP